MPRQAALLELARVINVAAAAADWTTLAGTEPKLQKLATLAAQRPWNARELAALAQLRAAHASAYRACVAARQQLGQQLSQMQDKKEGWMAYALHSDTEPEQQENRA